MIEIARMQAWALRCPTPEPIATSFGIMYDRSAVLLRVEDRDGAFGWGEIFANWPAAGAEHRVRLLEMDISNLVLGTKAKAPEDVFNKLNSETRIRANQCGEIGPFAQVIAGLDSAVWDLVARRADVPLRKLLNADARDQLPVYASGIHIAQAADLVPPARAAGHNHFKLKVGFGKETEIAKLEDVCTGLSPNEAVACDANQAWTLEQAQEFLIGIKHLKLAWLEEPMPVFADDTAWQTLARFSHIPLAGGENLIGEAAFAAAIQAGHLSVIQPDIAKWGGITGCLSVARNAISAGRRYCPHFLGAGIGLAASAELLAAAGGDGLLEIDFNPNPLRSAFFPNGQEPVRDGKWTLSDMCGIGVEEFPGQLSDFITLHVDLS